MRQRTRRRAPSRERSTEYNWVNKVNHFNISIYNQLLIYGYGRVSLKSAKLNSTKNDPFKRDHEDIYQPSRIEYAYTPSNTTITIKRSFRMLEDIQKQDLFRWRDEFL
ncbi:hypothetical protein DMUE_2119 [Dictyocoela muelleri]|nr:hypothetical protein DMUE_2119 [Dictyocoela muelleri]